MQSEASALIEGPNETRLVLNKTASDLRFRREYLTLTKPAFDRLCRKLEDDFDNKLSEPHKQALLRILSQYTALAAGEETGRWAFGLGCGLGKTAAAISWCAQMIAARRRYSVLICSSKIEDLAEIQRQLIGDGVPSAAIGTTHTYKFEPNYVDADGKLLKSVTDKKTGKTICPAEKRYASVPSTPERDASLKQILLCTHARLRAQRNTDKQGAIDRINSWRGLPRSLTIYDESLLVSDAFSVGCREIKEGLALLKIALEEEAPDETLLRTAAYLEHVWANIDADRTAQANRRPPATLRLPPLPADLPPSSMIECLPERGEPIDALRNLLSFGAATFRVADCSQGGGIIRYVISVPPELRNVVVLDASYPIRELERLDRSIKSTSDFDGNVKRYGGVVIRQLQHPAGRTALTKAFAAKKGDRLISWEIISAIKGIPENERVLLFTFKPRGKVDMAKTLREDMRAKKLEPDSSRFSWLTWGSESASNDFADIQNVFLVGVLQRSSVDLAASMIGQRDDLTAPLKQSDVLSLRVSEAAHCAYQAVNRAAMRRTINGQAAPTNVWLLWPDDTLKGVLDHVMPDAQWLPWSPIHLEGKAAGKIEEIARAISGHLRGLPSGTHKVSTTAIKRAVADLGTASRSTFSAAVGLVAVEGWRLEGRSFVRT